MATVELRCVVSNCVLNSTGIKKEGKIEMQVCVWAREQGHLCIYLCSLITCVSLDEEEGACGVSHLQF